MRVKKPEFADEEDDDFLADIFRDTIASDDTVTFAAPVVLNGIRGNMAASVVLTTDNFYRTHRIVMPDGSVFEFVKFETTDRQRQPGEGIANRPSRMAEKEIQLRRAQEEDYRSLYSYSTGFAGKILIPLMSGNRFTGEYSAEDSLRNLGYAIAKNYTIDPQTSNDVTNAYSDAKATLTSIKTDADNGNPIGALAYSLEPDEVRAAVREAERLTSGSGAIGKAEKELKRLSKAYSAEQNSGHSYSEKALALREIQKEINACKLAALEAYEEYCLKYRGIP